MSARIITIEAYDPQWVERYKDEALKLRTPGSRRQPAKPGGLWPVEKRICSAA